MDDKAPEIKEVETPKTPEPNINLSNDDAQVLISALEVLNKSGVPLNASAYYIGLSARLGALLPQK